MNIHTFRTDLANRLASDKERSLSAVAKQYGVEQASLHRFVKQNKGLSGEYVCALWPYVYGSAMQPLTTPGPDPAASTP